MRGAQLKPLYDWLWRINLPQVYEILIAAGYDDITVMKQHMTSALPMTNETLESIGITRVGHRMKLLLKLKEEAGLLPRYSLRKKGTAHSLFQCCVEPNNATGAFYYGLSIPQ